MPWITPADVTAVYPADDPSEELVAHVEGLAEGEIGEQDEPVKRCIKSITVDAVHRLLAASGRTVDPNVSQTSLGSFSETRSGLGLTDREIKKLKKCAGKTGLWIQPLVRSSKLETPGVEHEPLNSIVGEDDELAEF